MKKLISAALAAALALCLLPVDEAGAQWQVGKGHMPVGLGVGTTGFTDSNAALDASAYLTCDGITNVRAALNQAITDANAAGIGVVQLPAGVCIAGGNAAIALRSNIHLRGAGRGVTTLKLLASTSDDIIAGNGSLYGGIANVTVTDLTIDAGDFTSGVNAIFLGNAAANMRVERVEIKKMGTFGIAFQNVTGGVIRDNIIEKTTAASTQNQCINVSDTLQNSDIAIENNRCTNSGILYSGARMRVAGNVVSGHKYGCGVGTAASAFTHDNKIINNVLYGGIGIDADALPVCGIEAWGQRDVIAGNIIYANSGNGISFGGQYSIIANNVTYNNGTSSTAGWTYGIAARYVDATYNGSYSTVVGNRAFDSAGAGGTQTHGFFVGAMNTAINAGVNGWGTNKTAAVSIAAGTVTGTMSELTLGYAGAVTGQANLIGLTSGVVTMKVSDAAGTYNFWLPTAAGTAGQPLLSGGGSAAMTFGTLGVAGGGTGATTLTGLVLGNGTSAMTAYAGTACTNQFVRSLNASGVATCASVSLTADVSGDLPYANLAQGAALSVLGVAGNATADVASIAAGSDHNILRRSGSAVGFGSLDLSQSGAVGTSVLAVANGGTGAATFGANRLLIGNGTSAVSASNLYEVSGSFLMGPTSPAAGSPRLQLSQSGSNTLFQGVGAGAEFIIDYLGAGGIYFGGPSIVFRQAGGSTAMTLTTAGQASTSTATGTVVIATGGLGVPGRVVTGGGTQTPAVTVSNLPACSGTTQGLRYVATDANATTFAATVAGSGANIVPVTCNGTNWIIGANDNVPGTLRPAAAA